MGKIINDHFSSPNLNYSIIYIKMKRMKILISLIQY